MKTIEMDFSKRCWEEEGKVHNRWHPDIPPALEVDPEEEVYLQTRDALDGPDHLGVYLGGRPKHRWWRRPTP